MRGPEVDRIFGHALLQPCPPGEVRPVISEPPRVGGHVHGEGKDHQEQEDSEPLVPDGFPKRPREPRILPSRALPGHRQHEGANQGRTPGPLGGQRRPEGQAGGHSPRAKDGRRRPVGGEVEQQGFVGEVFNRWRRRRSPFDPPPVEHQAEEPGDDERRDEDIEHRDPGLHEVEVLRREQEPGHATPQNASEDRVGEEGEQGD